jgi:hypothetical protein
VSPPNLPILQGRGTTGNLPNRFDKIDLEPDGEHLDAEESIAPATVFHRDTSRSIIASNDSPDVGFEKSINPYRGCEHGCIYCYARPTHEWLGFSAGLDFETKIMVKENAAQLLRDELSRIAIIHKNGPKNVANHCKTLHSPADQMFEMDSNSSIPEGCRDGNQI